MKINVSIITLMISALISANSFASQAMIPSASPATTTPTASSDSIKDSLLEILSLKLQQEKLKTQLLETQLREAQLKITLASPAPVPYSLSKSSETNNLLDAIRNLALAKDLPQQALAQLTPVPSTYTPSPQLDKLNTSFYAYNNPLPQYFALNVPSPSAASEISKPSEKDAALSLLALSASPVNVPVATVSNPVTSINKKRKQPDTGFDVPMSLQPTKKLHTYESDEKESKESSESFSFFNSLKTQEQSQKLIDTVIEKTFAEIEKQDSLSEAAIQSYTTLLQTLLSTIAAKKGHRRDYSSLKNLRIMINLSSANNLIHIALHILAEEAPELKLLQIDPKHAAKKARSHYTEVHSLKESARTAIKNSSTIIMTNDQKYTITKRRYAISDE